MEGQVVPGGFLQTPNSKRTENPGTENPAYTPLILKPATISIQREERLAKTGVGWILREMSRHNLETTREFIDKNLKYFSREALNNAMKYFPGKKQPQ